MEICNWCTKDACTLHICDKCKRCSDCCACDVPLNKEAPVKPPTMKEQGFAEPAVQENVQEES